jgi:hypothetical protein
MGPKNEGPTKGLSLGTIVRSLYKGGKVIVGDGKNIRLEPRQSDRAHWSFPIRWKTTRIVSAHQEGASGKRDYSSLILSLRTPGTHDLG